MTNRRLRDGDITNILHTYEDSEDGMENDDDSVADPDYQAENEMELEQFSSDENEDDEVNVEEIIQGLEDSEPEPTVVPRKPQKLNLRWKKKSLLLTEQQLRFLGNENLTADILELDTPIRVFLYLFPKDLFDFIAAQTNLYIVQKDPNNNFRLTAIDIQQFIGIVYIMSLIQLPRVTSHWTATIGTPLIQSTMSVKMFEKIRQFIHFNDNCQNLPLEHPEFDRLFKIRPIVQKLNQSFAKVPLEQYLCVDEQICSTKARNNLKRYNPKKPHKWGYKIYVLSGVSGFAYKFEPETGSENVVLPDEPDLGASSNVVMRLSREIPHNENYRLYFDNYFTSLPLLEYLSKKGILSLGTVRRNRIPDCKLPTDKIMSKKDRGYSVEYVADVNGVDIATVAWKDNKVVNLASSFVGEMPKAQVRRYDKKNKRYVSIDRPNIVGEYNRHMGGVDLIDSIMGRYKIQLRSKRWQVRMFYHLLDLSMANAWLLYKRIHKAKGLQDKTLNSADFRLEVATTLCKLGVPSTMNSRRSIENEIQAKRHKGPAQHVPPVAIRQDQTGHWPVWTEKRTRCKFPNCSGVSQTMCEKCGVALCYNKHNNCFRQFHLS